MNEIDHLKPKIGDWLVDIYGKLEITSCFDGKGLMIVKRQQSVGVSRNPFTISYGEWASRCAHAAKTGSVL